MDTILVVDDEPAIATLLDQVIKKLGYRPVVVLQATGALSAFIKEKPVLAIIDYMLPGLDGGQLFKLIRSTPEGARMPVIFITAMSVKMMRDRVGEQAGVRFMQKPLDFADMRRNIDELLASKAIRPSNKLALKAGKIKWFRPEKSHGYITPDDGSPAIFFNSASFAPTVGKSLTIGQAVEYQVVIAGASTRAVDVNPIVSLPGGKPQGQA